METADRGPESWVAATLDLLLGLIGLAIVLHPLISLWNTVLGSPVSPATVSLIVGVLAFGGAYPIVAGDWSLGRLGEYVVVLFASVLAWGLLGMVAILVSNVTIQGNNAAPQAIVWTAASLTAYLLVYRARVSLFR
ncbi:hypothetical protein [Halopenitus persicus]|uniref:Uncharacterized protein n=1 Tax=Halopenitus persicus TaxID=1048396 RepID=A0A1H3GZU2_9EURY|nr:hypothetical protein [Halopenitus persicus]SDY08751.1 hypothetical protein SAMN05216564_10359 [Halopenitus persicus]